MIYVLWKSDAKHGAPLSGYQSGKSALDNAALDPRRAVLDELGIQLVARVIHSEG
jgi:hypothetical protein